MSDHNCAETVAANLTELLIGRKRWTFSLENGRGETYQNARPTLYGHSTYERSSVLAGRPQRVFVAQWDDWAAARETIERVKALVKVTRRKLRIEVDDCGTTYIPTERLVAHLPDDTDY